MYKAGSLIKIIVLVCFAALMSAFVAYRSGSFDKYIYNKGDINSLADNPAALNTLDTTAKPKLDSAELKRIMSDPEVIRMASSKSARIIEDWPARTKPIDSILKITSKYTNKLPLKDTVIKPKTIMSSSKSMILIDRPKKVKQDTVIKPVSDAINKVLPDTAKPVRFYGSKSGIIFKPDDVKVIDKKEKKKLKKKNKTSE